MAKSGVATRWSAWTATSPCPARSDPAFTRHLNINASNSRSECCYKHFFDARGARACGFKLKYDEMVQPRWSDIRRLVEADTDIGIVFLHRDDLLQRYLSHQVVLRQTGVTNVPSGGDVPRIDPFEVDIGDCLADIEETAAATA